MVWLGSANSASNITYTTFVVTNKSTMIAPWTPIYFFNKLHDPCQLEIWIEQTDNQLTFFRCALGQATCRYSWIPKTKQKKTLVKAQGWRCNSQVPEWFVFPYRQSHVHSTWNQNVGKCVHPSGKPANWKVVSTQNKWYLRRSVPPICFWGEVAS